MNQEALDIFIRLKAIVKNDHILYTSGKHGAEYVNKDALYPYTQAISRVCEIIADDFVKDQVDVVVAPAVGGIVLTQWIAHHLSKKTGREVLAVYAEKQADGLFAFKRGYGDLIEGKNVLIAEDVLNTGGSAKKVVELVKDSLGAPVGLAVLCNRGKVKPEDVSHVPRIFSLVEVDFEAWDSNDCPLCKKGIPISKEYGKGSKS